MEINVLWTRSAHKTLIHQVILMLFYQVTLQYFDWKCVHKDTPFDIPLDNNSEDVTLDGILYSELTWGLSHPPKVLNWQEREVVKKKKSSYSRNVHLFKSIESITCSKNAKWIIYHNIKGERIKPNLIALSLQIQLLGCGFREAFHFALFRILIPLIYQESRPLYNC